MILFDSIFKPLMVSGHCSVSGDGYIEPFKLVSLDTILRKAQNHSGRAEKKVPSGEHQ